MKFRNFITIFILTFCSVFSALAIESKKESPTRITSYVIDIKRKSQMMNFIGNVMVKKGSDTMIADKMTVFYEDKSMNATNSKIKKIEAKNNVKISSAEFVATGNSGYYDQNQGLFILEENVVVNNGSSIANGDKFIYNLTTKKGNLIGGQQPIKGTDKRVVVIIGDDIKNKKSKHD